MADRTIVGDDSRTRFAAVRQARAWFALTCVLALHVLDEALTGFLDFYNPLVSSIRSQLRWFPMPTFTFEVWIAGLVALVLVLLSLSPLVRRGAAGTAAACWVLSIIMFSNGVGHLAGSVYFKRWLPGATSAPLLLVASVLLARATWQRQHSDRGPTGGSMSSAARTSALVLILFSGVPANAAAQTDLAATCARLADQSLPNTTISIAEAVTGGSFTQPGSTNPMTNLPPFCRVAGVIKPTTESHVLFEVWLPLQNWNGRYAGVGNGGWAGNISYGALAEQLRRGGATASTNTGHEAAPGVNAARFAFDYPERLVDFAYRAHHETALKAKALVQAFYGKPPDRSYMIGCSSGGYEGLMEAQRFPADYDGILAGAPANNWTRLMAGDLEATLALLKDSVSQLPVSALGVLHRGVLAACDAADGVPDGILENPRACRFDPAVLQCGTNANESTCLAPAQVAAARRVYAGIRDPKTGEQLYPGLAPGSEPLWPNRDPAAPFPIPISHYKWLVFADPNWDWKTFDFSDPADYEAFLAAEKKFAPLLNATDPNLQAFRQRGGKLLQFHGWNDQLISPYNSINYYESVISFFQGANKDRTAALIDVQSFYRLFMAPGMGHCAGGQGPNTFDLQTALEGWVERGIVPESITATRAINGVVDRLRPLCSYPKIAVYKGKGDTNEATNFECREGKPVR